MKKLQVKYEWFNTISKTYNLVWQKDKGVPRFIYVCTAEDTISFKEIHAKTEKPFLIMTIAIILSKSYIKVLLQ